MVTDITQDDLILLAYGELSPDRKKHIESAISEDLELKKTYGQICSSMKVLDSAKCSPADTSVQIILEESCSSSAAEMV